MVPAAVARVVGRYLDDLDRLLPGAVVGFYVVGSVALGAYREGRSDIDFVAMVDGELGPAGLRRLRALHIRSGVRTASAAVRHGRSVLTGTCNGIFVRWADVEKPVTQIAPVASHSGTSFTTGPVGSDVSPVAWKVLAERGIPMRGPEPRSLPLDPQPELLTSWNRGNLERYWRPWALAVQRAPRARFRLRPGKSMAWGMLGAPRLHHTIATGDVISKEQAGEYALDAFPARWHPLIGDALAYRRGEPSRLGLSLRERAQRTAEFVLEVVDAAHEIGPATAGESR
jgi:aminoglycoside adenylyltransferase-like protein/nucleotidyltransferase-like protein